MSVKAQRSTWRPLPLVGMVNIDEWLSCIKMNVSNCTNSTITLITLRLDNEQARHVETPDSALVLGAR
jgi:hypothetical protein